MLLRKLYCRKYYNYYNQQRYLSLKSIIDLLLTNSTSFKGDSASCPLVSSETYACLPSYSGAPANQLPYRLRKQQHNYRIKHLIHQLQIYPTYPIILVGGTNGKGSTCAYLSNILIQSGYKVGSFSSPHLLRYNERIAINNNPINDYLLKKLLILVGRSNNYQLGLFNTFALAAYKFFIMQKVDIAVIEVGIGGRHDITNMFTPTISAITNVGLDHCDLLGDSKEAIGLEKAAIYRPNSYAFFGHKTIPKSTNDYIQQIGATKQLFGQDFDISLHELSFDVCCDKNTNREKNYYCLPYPALRGIWQPRNAALAISILHKLATIRPAFTITLGAIKQGLLATKLLGRFDVLATEVNSPQVVIDVAHNEDAVKVMLDNMLQLPFAKNCYAVFSLANDKDLEAIISLCVARGVFKNWYIAPIKKNKTFSSTKICEVLINNNVSTANIHCFSTIKDAYVAAHSDATQGDRIMCFGSFLVAEEIYSAN